MEGFELKGEGVEKTGEPRAKPTMPPFRRAKTNMPMAKQTSSSGTEACIGIVRAGYGVPSPAISKDLEAGALVGVGG